MDQDPLSEFECMMSVVDPKGKGENKWRYIVATQDEDLVSFCKPGSALPRGEKRWLTGTFIFFIIAAREVTFRSPDAADVCAEECVGKFYLIEYSSEYPIFPDPRD